MTAVFGHARRLQEMQGQISNLSAELAHYQQRFEHMPEGFALGEAVLSTAGKLVDYRYLEVNAAFCQATGLPRDIVGHPSQEWASPQQAGWREPLCGIALDGLPRRFQQHNPDTGHHYEVYGYCPAPGQFALLYRDISHQLQLEQRLVERESHLLQIIESLPGMVWTAGPDGRVDYLSPQWRAYIHPSPAPSPRCLPM